MSDPVLQNNDDFLVSRSNQTYKVSFESLKRDIGGTYSGNTEPSDPVDGNIWINTAVCPPQLFVYSECEGTPGQWYPISGSPTNQVYLEKDANGNVYIPGSLYVVNDVSTFDATKTSTAADTNTILLDASGSLLIYASVFVKGDIYHGVPYGSFNPVENQLLEDNGDLIITGNTGHLVVGGNVVTKYTSPI